jgi:hypothetical protein
MARKNPSTLTWLLIAGGVGVGAFLFWRSRRKAATVPSVMTAPAPSLPAPAPTTAPPSTASPIRIMTAAPIATFTPTKTSSTHEWVTKADGTGYWRRKAA